MMRYGIYRAWGIGMAILAAGTTVQADAKPRSPLGKWFCTVLKPGFDMNEAIKSFPLEKLGEPEETRKNGDGYVSVDLIASGEEYQAVYSYQFKPDNVSKTYGFSLDVRKIEGGFGATAAEEGKKWLREFGKPQSSITGWRVFAGPPIFEGGDKVFHFDSSSMSSEVGASWFGPKDVKFAEELCV